MRRSTSKLLEPITQEINYVSTLERAKTAAPQVTAAPTIKKLDSKRKGNSTAYPSASKKQI